MTDDLVAQQNGSIRSWWQLQTVRAGRSADAVPAKKAAPTPWPGDLVRGLGDPRSHHG